MTCTVKNIKSQRNSEIWSFLQNLKGGGGGGRGGDLRRKMSFDIAVSFIHLGMRVLQV